MMEALLPLLSEQSPMFMLLVGLGRIFYRFMDRQYTDHKSNMDNLQKTFTETINNITKGISDKFEKIEGRFDKVEDKIDGISGR